MLYISDDKKTLIDMYDYHQMMATLSYGRYVLLMLHLLYVIRVARRSECERILFWTPIPELLSIFRHTIVNWGKYDLDMPTDAYVLCLTLTDKKGGVDED